MRGLNKKCSSSLRVEEGRKKLLLIPSCVFTLGGSPRGEAYLLLVKDEKRVRKKHHKSGRWNDRLDSAHFTLGVYRPNGLHLRKSSTTEFFRGEQGLLLLESENITRKKGGKRGFSDE